MTHNTLKQQARALAVEHQVPYSKALQAVDEPLHQLRDLIAYSSQESHGHFRLIQRADDTYSYIRRGSSSVFNQAPSEYIEIIREMVRRLDLIKQANADDVWEYRRLHRLGLVDEPMEILEYCFDSHSSSLASLLDQPTTSLTGIVVIMSHPNSFTKTSQSRYLSTATPVTVETMRRLLSGTSTELPPRYSDWETADISGGSVIKIEGLTALVRGPISPLLLNSGLATKHSSKSVTVRHAKGNLVTARNNDTGYIFFGGRGENFCVHSPDAPHPRVSQVMAAFDASVVDNPEALTGDYEHRASWILEVGAYSQMVAEVNDQLPRHDRWSISIGEHGHVDIHRSGHLIRPVIGLVSLSELDSMSSAMLGFEHGYTDIVKVRVTDPHGKQRIVDFKGQAEESEAELKEFLLTFK